MLTKEAYAYYEAGAAVAAVHLKLRLKQVSINPARGVTDVAFPRDGLKAKITLWLTGLAAEKKGVGETDAFRRMKNRQRIRAEIAGHAEGRPGPRAKRGGDGGDGASILNQAQDRANAICGAMFPAIRLVAARLLVEEFLPGAWVEQAVADFRLGKVGDAGTLTDPAAQPDAPPRPLAPDTPAG